MRTFVINTDDGGEYVAQLTDASAREIARNGCKIGPLDPETKHSNPMFEST